MNDPQPEKLKLFVISHTHWDREWYGSFQLFRLRLVRLMNKLLALLEHDPDYVTFNLDGQTVIVEDYLEVHPEQRETLQRFISEGRLMVGPWYILPDEFLTSGESLVRNLLLGGQMARQFGHRMNVGYIPDTFGHIAQLPQILQGFDIDNCMNFRGMDSGDRSGTRDSELWWESPDGSRVLLHHMSTEIGYSDLGAMATDAQRAAYDLRATAYYKAQRATGNVLLAMQGVDHAEAREDLTQIIGIANDTFEDVEFVHSSLEDFWSALKQSVEGKTLETVVGELRDVPRTEGSMNFLLYNVLSSRADNKIQNAQTLISLEQWAEPWCAMAWLNGIAEYPQGHLWVAWKWLLKNHPHDSIGGCSVDEVHRQMATRFEWAKEIADYLVEERFYLLAERINTGSAHADEIALTVFNASPFEREEVITVDVYVPEYWLKQQAVSRFSPTPELTPDSPYLHVKDVNTRADWLYGMPEMPEVFFRSVRIRTFDENALDALIPVQIHSIEQTTKAIALASGPRGVVDVRRVRVSFPVKIPALGYNTYYVKTDPNPPRWQPQHTPPAHGMRNEHLSVRVNQNGTFDLTLHHEQGDIAYQGLGLFEDSGDNGDGYTFSPPPTNRTYTTLAQSPRISHVGNGVNLQQIRIEYDFMLPVGLDDARQKRRDEMTPCPITVDLTLRDGSQHLELRIHIENRARDHRLRLRFPTGLQDVSEASSAMQFDVMTRPIRPQPIAPQAWWVESPPDTFPMHSWMNVHGQHASGQTAGLGVIAEGVYEFGVEAFSDSTDIALTLLRAVGYLGARRDPTTIIGGAGPSIPTPEAQLQKSLTYRIALVPHLGDWQRAHMPQHAQRFLASPRAITTTPHDGDMSPAAEGIRIEGENGKAVPVLSALKRAEQGIGREDGSALILRLFNPANEPSSASIHFPAPVERAHVTNLEENHALEEIPVIEGNQLHVNIPQRRIVTLKVYF